MVHAALRDPEVRHLSMGGQVQLWDWTEDDVYVMSGPCYHASHAGWGLTVLYAGATTVIPARFEAEGFLRNVERYRGTRSFMVPAHFIRILQLPDATLKAIDASSLHLVVHGAAPCPLNVKRRMMETFGATEFHELYGASEGGATRISPQEWLEHPGSVGRAWPGVEIRVLGEDGVPSRRGRTASSTSARRHPRASTTATTPTPRLGPGGRRLHRRRYRPPE